MSTDGARAAVFLDRDDTVLIDEHYMNDPAQVRVIPGVGRALRRLQEAGFALVLISNQSGVGRGWITPGQVEAIQRRMCELLPGVTFSGFEYCFHRPDETCPCRKPKPLMIQRAAARLNIDLSRSAMVGDTPKDVQAGQAAGCKGIQVPLTDASQREPKADHIAPTLGHAADWIIATLKPEIE